MANSQEYRVRFWTLSSIFVVVLLSILVVLSLVSDRFSRYKIDMTEDQLFTISPGFKNILGDLKDKVIITYYTSEDEKMPSMLGNLRRDTVDLFEEIRALSDQMVEYKVVYLEEEADEFAREKVEEYRRVENDDDDETEPEEPEPRQSIADLFSGGQQQKKTPEEIREARWARARKMAKAQGRDSEDVFYDILHSEWKNHYLDGKEEEGIRRIPIQERSGSEVREVAFYSALEIRYLDKPPEIIPFYYQLQNLELELATNVLRLTNTDKPVVAFFDGRPLPTPEQPPNPMQAPPPTSEYTAVTAYLNEMFDLRRVSLEEGDSLADLKETIQKEAEEESDSDGSGEKAAEIACLIVAQPDGLNERQVFEISKAVSEGVPTIFLVSRHSLDVSQGRQGGMSQGYPINFLHPGLEEYFRSFGVGIETEILASNSCAPMMAPMDLGGGRIFMAPFPFSICVMATAQDGLIDENDPLTNRIPNLVFPASNGLTLDEGKFEELDLKVDKLAKTHEYTWATRVLPFSTSPFGRGQPTTVFSKKKDLVDQKRDVERYEDEFLDEQRPLAVRISGKVPFFFQGKAVPEWPEEPEDGDAAQNTPPGIQGLPQGLPRPPGPGGPAGPQQDASPAESGGTDAPTGGGESDEESSGASEGSSDAPVESPTSDAGAASNGSDEPAEAGPPAPQETPPPAPQPAGDGASAGDDEPAAKPEPASVDVVDGNILIVNSADALKDAYFQNRQLASTYESNLLFFRNAIETYGLGDDLLKIRRKTLTQRHFEDATPGNQLFIHVVNFVIVPVIVGAIGLTLFIARRVQASRYEQAMRKRLSA